MDNYDYCAEWVNKKVKSRKNIFVLDFGCGSGQIVKKLQDVGFNSFGCDVFYEAANYQDNLVPGLRENSIQNMANGKIPFENGAFDLVINNQVMEHVEDIDLALAEIKRVLKPEGKVLSLFPCGHTWREGHCGIPFLHWFPKHTQLRVLYGALCRFMGLGHNKTKKGIDFSRYYCEWLDKWTFYRTWPQITSAYKKYFSQINSIEDKWLLARLGRRAKFISWLPSSLLRFVTIRMCGLVFEAQKK